MLDIFVNSDEHRRVKEAFRDVATICPIGGYDMALYTKSGLIPIERKGIPGDFLSSVTDGRLSKQIIAMREESSISILLLGPGRFNFDSTGHLKVRGKVLKWTNTSIRNLLRTIQFVEGIYIEPTIGYIRTYKEMAGIVVNIYDFFNNEKHLSMKGRPGIQTDWIVPSREERIRHFYQGLPNISTSRARALNEHFPTPIDLFLASEEDLTKLPRFGKTLVGRIYQFLHGG